MANAYLDSIIRAYLQAAEEKKEAEAKYNKLRDELMEVLDNENLAKYKGAFANITIVERKSYDYPDDIVTEQEILKAKERAAIKTGQATIAKVTRYPKVTITE